MGASQMTQAEGSQGPVERRMIVHITPEAAIGVYAAFVSIWHDAESFTLDFSVPLGPPQLREEESTGQQFAQMDAQIVSRVRIPPSQVFEIMKALENQLSAWELENGRKPGEPPR